MKKISLSHPLRFVSSLINTAIIMGNLKKNDSTVIRFFGGGLPDITYGPHNNGTTAH